jgi:hypothetical protein
MTIRPKLVKLKRLVKRFDGLSQRMRVAGL